MIRRFCDHCGAEMLEGNPSSDQLQAAKVRGGARLVVRLQVIEGRDACLYCILDTVKQLDDRSVEG